MFKYTIVNMYSGEIQGMISSHYYRKGTELTGKFPGWAVIERICNEG